LDLNGAIARRLIFDPTHQKVPTSATILQDVPTELGRHRSNHGHIGGAKERAQPYVRPELKNGNMQVSVR
jgi:hypothetical protein